MAAASAGFTRPTRASILGVNGVRLIGKRSGVGRAIEAVLQCLGELQHPFTDIRVYSPQPLDESIALPPQARSIVLPARLPLGLWEQLILPRAHGSRGVLFCRDGTPHQSPPPLHAFALAGGFESGATPLTLQAAMSAVTVLHGLPGTSMAVPGASSHIPRNPPL